MVVIYKLILEYQPFEDDVFHFDNKLHLKLSGTWLDTTRSKFPAPLPHVRGILGAGNYKAIWGVG